MINTKKSAQRKKVAGPALSRVFEGEE